MKDYYNEGSELFYFSEGWRYDRAILEMQGACLLDLEEANAVGVQDLIHGINQHQKAIINSIYKVMILPYELDDEMPGYGMEGVDFISKIIEDSLDKDIYIASTNPSMGCVAKSSTVNPDVIYGVSPWHLNTPFVIFDKHKNFAVIVDFDFPIQLILVKDEARFDKEFFIKEREELFVKKSDDKIFNMLFEDSYRF